MLCLLWYIIANLVVVPGGRPHFGGRTFRTCSPPSKARRKTGNRTAAAAAAAAAAGLAAGAGAGEAAEAVAAADSDADADAYSHYLQPPQNLHRRRLPLQRRPG